MAATITYLGGNAVLGATTPLSSGAIVTATVANNDWLVVVVAASNTGGGVGTSALGACTDSAGNSYTQRVNAYFTAAGSNGDGGVIAFYTAPVTTNITGGTISVALTATTTSTIEVYRVRPSSGTISFVAADTAPTGNAAATNHAAATVSVSNGNTIFGAACIRTNDPVTGDSDTTNGSWSTAETQMADGTSDTFSRTGVTQYKTVNATGNQSWAASTTSARASICSYLVLKTSSAAFTLATALGQYTMSGTAMTPHLGNVPMVAGAGAYALTGTAATFINTGTTKTIAAGVGDYALAGTDATLTLGHKLDATTAGNYALTGTDAALRRNLPMVAGVGSYALAGIDAVLTKASAAAKVLGADAGSYSLLGTDATLTITTGKSLVADPGSYAVIGTDPAVLHNWITFVTPRITNICLQSQTFNSATWGKTGLSVSADAIADPTGSLTADKLVESVGGTFHLTFQNITIVANTIYTVSCYFKAGERTAVSVDFTDAATGNNGLFARADLIAGTISSSGAFGSGTALTSATISPAGNGFYRVALTGQLASGVTGSQIKFALLSGGTNNYSGDGVSGAYAWQAQLEVGTQANLPILTTTTAVTDGGAGSYALTGSVVALSTAANKVILGDVGSYALVGTDATLTAGVAPPSVSPLHMGEWPRDTKRRRAREDAQDKEQRARKRFREAIGRLLEGLPPEFDEPEQLAEAEVSAVKAFNLLRAMYAPQPELDAVSQLINHIRQLRIAQPIAQLHLAQAYNQAHRHLAHKAQEDAVMALLLGE